MKYKNLLEQKFDDVREFRKKLYKARHQKTHSSYSRGIGHDNDIDDDLDQTDGWTVYVTCKNGRDVAVTFPCEHDHEHLVYLYEPDRTLGPYTCGDKGLDVVIEYVTTDMPIDVCVNKVIAS